MTDLVQPQGNELATDDRRSFGIGAQPQLWLNMGYRDPNRRGAPVKTSYFGVRETDEFASERRRFFEVFGLEPREVEIMLPSRLEDALDIRYRAFVGGGEGKGRLAAIGQTNFALTGKPGRDILNVWSNDTGEVTELPIAALDDPFAKQRLKQHLGPKAEIELSMIFKFGIPKVLGIGGIAAISSKGQKTFRNLWQTLAQLYGLFGTTTSFAVQPMLFMREASSPYLDPKTKKWARSDFYALDLRTQETLEETFDRLRERGALLQGTPPGATAVLPPAQAARGGEGQPIEPQISPPAAAADDEPEPVEGDIVDDQPAAREGQHVNEDQQVIDGVAPSSEQFQKLNAILEELQHARTNYEAEDGTLVPVSDWRAYAKTWCKTTFGTDDARQLSAAQVQQLTEYLDSLTIPF